jgi:hypothetical protein
MDMLYKYLGLTKIQKSTNRQKAPAPKPGVVNTNAKPQAKEQ